MRASKPAAAVLVAVGLLAAGVGTAGLLTRHPAVAASRPAALVTLPAPSGPIAAVPEPSGPRRVAEPETLTIPAIGVRTRLIRLGLTTTGALQVPSSTSVAGWYTGSSRPGAIGPAVIAGHIDSYTGPGIFYRLNTLRAGDRVFVKRADGTVVVFRVVSVRIYPKNAFPTQAVYGPVPDAELRLITCGGVFDPSLGSYLSNVVVFATETS